MLFGVDKYSVFLGGSAGRLEITGGESRPRLLIVRDSYASAVAPFWHGTSIWIWSICVIRIFLCRR